MTSDILEMKSITKKFPGVIALNNVSFNCQEGEVHALMGENGAGKSTLMKLLNGISHPTSGEIFFKGKIFKASNSREAQNAGIAIIYQELNVVPGMNAVENIFLGREIVKNGIVMFSEMKRKAEKLLEQLEVSINLNTPVNRLSVAEQQMIEIAKALSMEASLVVMDEPTASLSTREIEALYKTIGKMKAQGVTIIYISHHLDEVFEVCDRVTVLKDGVCMGTKDVSAIDEPMLIKMMVGRTLEEIYPPKSKVKKEKIIEIRNLTRKGTLEDISLNIYKGEILGIAGLVGAGRTELARAIFGADMIDKGEIIINGKKQTIKKPIDAMRNNIGFVTEDRKDQGLVLGMSVRHNMTLTFLKTLTKSIFINGNKEKKIVEDFIKSLRIATPGMDAKVLNLSGGNQQKVVLAKWLARNCEVIILDEPTRGIDVGAKVEIYNLMRDLANKGTAILMISSELSEVLGMSDRVIVMRNGRLAGELSHEESTEEKIVAFAMGGSIT